MKQFLFSKQFSVRFSQYKYYKRRGQELSVLKKSPASTNGYRDFVRMGKRLDLQCLRGIAIVEVLLFHFWPKIFNNGYIGVDLFFVLSGFLISMILHRSSLPILEVFKNFYYSRVKRIFPAYLLFIFVTLVSLFFIFPETNIAINITSAFPALFFYTNLIPADGVSRYEALLAVGDNLFTHTWSLAVEIQFYLLVPFIYLASRYLGIPKSALLISALSAGSLLFYLLADENTSFNYVVARLWQFLTGYMVYLKIHVDRMKPAQKKSGVDEVTVEKDLSKKTSEETKEPSTLLRCFTEGSIVIVLIALLVLGFNPIATYQKDQLRVVTTVLAAIFIYLGKRTNNPIFGFKPLCYLGDISYILYLVHYPIHVYLNLHKMKSNQAKFNGFALSFFFAILIHELFEKFYLKLKKVPILALVTFLYLGSILIVIFSPQIDFALFGPKLNFHDVLRYRDRFTIEDLTKLNLRFNMEDPKRLWYPQCVYEDHHGPFGICRAPGNPKKTATALIVGNSYAPNTFRGFYSQCQNSFKTITMESYSACEVLWDSIKFEPKHHCTGIQERFINHTEKMAPDYLFINSRHIFLHPPRKSSQKDIQARTETVRATIKKFERSVKKKIFILTSFYLPPHNVMRKVNHAMLKKNSTHNLFPKGLGYNDSPVLKTRQIIQKAISDCSKCEIMDVNPYFVDEDDVFHHYDDENGLVYFVNSQHFSPYGIHKIEPLFKDVCLNRL